MVRSSIVWRFSSKKLLLATLTCCLTGWFSVAAAEEGSGRPGPEAAAASPLAGFFLGSYGRVGFASDLRGAPGKPLTVVGHGPRLEEPPYVELDLGYDLVRHEALSFHVHSTVAFLEDLFHYNGEFEAKLALRNLYAEARHVLTRHLSLWAGSRMLRGDDLYLLDYWPLDNLNTLGGGLLLSFARTSVSLHAGVNRLEQGSYQYQLYPVPDPRYGAEEVATLDRQRTVISGGVSQLLPSPLPWASVKLRLYGELHQLPSGTWRQELQREHLPADLGWVVGLQLGAQRDGSANFGQFWLRGAGGLGAYGELVVPFGLDLDKKAADARELVLAANGNYERKMVGLMGAAYLRYFADADGIESDPDDGWEYALALRPHLFLHRYLQQVFEVSLQGRRPAGLDPRSQTHLMPKIFKASLMPTVSWDRGTYARPQLRLVYTLAYLDSGARQLFSPEDPRYGRAIHHFLGVQAEWWYNSSYR